MKKRRKSDNYLQDVRAAQVFNAGRGRKKGKSSLKIPFKPKKLKSLGTIGELSRTSLFGGTSEKHIILPKNFSIIENPEEALHRIAAVAVEADNPELRVIRFDHSQVTSHDLAAELLLGEVSKELKNHAKYRNRSIQLFGKLPPSERKKRLIRSMGVIKRLDIVGEMIREGEGNIEIFDFAGEKSSSIHPGSEDRKNRCGRLFVEHLNKCLEYNGRQLTDDAVQRLLDFIGEIIGNAEDHSGEKKWFVSGYLDDTKSGDDDPENEELHFCEIVIFNFGKSIAQTFLDLPKNSYAFSLINPYLKHHAKRGFFGPSWREEDLITLAALQSYISSKHADESSDRGQGTIDLIEFFQKVAKECASDLAIHAKMCILSGQTHILFDDRYSLRADERGRELIAFNDANDLNQRPDPRHIKRLRKAHFPGTMISIRFPLTSIHTEDAETAG